MIELTPEQRNALALGGESPLRVIDPATDTKYVLVREEVYDRVKQVFAADEEGSFIEELAPQTLAIFGRDGWDDPAMDVYNDLDPRRSS